MSVVKRVHMYLDWAWNVNIGDSEWMKRRYGNGNHAYTVTLHKFLLSRNWNLSISKLYTTTAQNVNGISSEKYSTMFQSVKKSNSSKAYATVVQNETTTRTMVQNVCNVRKMCICASNDSSNCEKELYKCIQRLFKMQQQFKIYGAIVQNIWNQDLIFQIWTGGGLKNSSTSECLDRNFLCT